MTGARSPERELRDHLEDVEAELQSALRTAFDLQRQLAAARAEVALLQRTVRDLETRAGEAAEVRDVFAAAMTTKFQPVPNAPVATGLASALSVIGLLLFLAMLWHSMGR